ncbi:MAG: FKBP-type peptidyl-prolyl cis-trans isomerase [Deltaproteobacteria bacterium]|nr:FKBP-type peptidyl-prolyl cis-trans isomerase [Deltaproteobacteria bacterium]MBI4795702.1 FKBP-type peptidyl-prolyl cis-trans isomerase [Deltaproteobacteria bacterium]
MIIDKNSFVTIDYLIRMGEREYYPPDGRSEEISFCMGWGVMPPGLEEALLGLEENVQKVVRLSPGEAYGESDQELIMEVPRTDFAPDVELKAGQVFETEDEEGHPVYFVVQEVRPETAVLDFNHPLAGKELEVSFTVRRVRESTPEDLQQQPSCGCGCEGDPQQH